MLNVRIQTFVYLCLGKRDEYDIITCFDLSISSHSLRSQRRLEGQYTRYTKKYPQILMLQKKDPFNAISFLEKDKYWIGIGCICISICICISLTLQYSWLLAVQHTICFHILYLYLSLYCVFVFVFIFCICIFLTAQCSWLLAVQETICIASISEPVPYLSTPICPSRLPSYL